MGDAQEPPEEEQGLLLPGVDPNNDGTGGVLPGRRRQNPNAINSTHRNAVMIDPNDSGAFSIASTRTTLGSSTMSTVSQPQNTTSTMRDSGLSRGSVAESPDCETRQVISLIQVEPSTSEASSSGDEAQ